MAAKKKSTQSHTILESWWIGCCGFPLARKEYFRRFRTVEVQQTFYQPPEPKTLERWRAEAPSDFVFTIKAWQVITHAANSPTYRRLRKLPDPARPEECGGFRWTPTVRAAWEVTLQAAAILQARVIVFQCPAAFRPTEENARRLVEFIQFARESIDRFVAEGRLSKPPLLAWEPRGNWSGEQIRSLCQTCGLIHAVDPFQSLPVTPPPAYFRLHGMPAYSHQYTDEELRQISRWLQEFRSGWCLFNNRTMAEDAQRLLQWLTRTSEKP